MNAKHVALLALLAVGCAGAAVAQPPDYPPPDEVQPPADSYMDQPPPPDAYQGAPQEDLQPPPYDQPYERPDTSYVRPYRGGAVDVSFFYEQLSPYGHWVERRPYGWVWLPFGIRAGWRPYALGRWVMTDYGWTWVSEEPFGWATYHYGRWIYDPEYGWEWVPGYEWGPAWVAWRTGAGYIGWAPLPPEVRFRIGIGLDFRGINLSVALGPSHFCFVEERAFLAPRVAVYVQPPARNVTIINNTTNITNYTVVNNRVVNQGIAVQRVEQVTGRRVERMQVAVARTGDPGASQVRGNQLTVFQPAIVRTATPPPPPPVHVRASGADLERKHQQEAQSLQQQQAQESSRLQQLHQRELQGGGAYQGGPARGIQRQPGQPAAAQPQAEPRRLQQPVEQQRQPGQPTAEQPQTEPRRSPQPVEPQRQPQAAAEPPRQPQAEQPRRQPVQERQAAGERQPAPQRGGQGGASAQDLAQRHQAEMQALQQQHQREQQQLQARHQAEQQSAQRQPPPQAQQRRGQQPQQQKGEPQQKEQQKDKKRLPEGPPPQHRR
jgi:hypothetical protein